MKEENTTADDSGFKPSGGTWGRQMKRLSDFEILRKEHDILARKLDRIEGLGIILEGIVEGMGTFHQKLDLIDENLSLHASDTVLMLDRIEKILEEHVKAVSTLADILQKRR